MLKKQYIVISNTDYNVIGKSLDGINFDLNLKEIMF